MTTFTDDFNRADSSNLGAGWVEVSGDWSIVSNQLSPGAAGGTIILRAATTAATDDNYSQVAITSATVASQGVWCRGDATIANGYLWRNNGTQWDLFAVVGGSFTVIATYAAAAANGDVMKVQAVGTAIKAFVNGVQRASVTDTSVAAGKNLGIRSESVSGVRYDNFSGGDVGGATVNATMALDGGAGIAAATAKRVVYATVAAAGAAGSLAAAASRTVHGAAALNSGAGTLSAAASRTVHATVAVAGGAGALAMTGSTGGALERPNATVVAKAWLYAIGFDPVRVANELPARADWPGPIDGFTTVMPLVANSEQYVPLQHPVIQFDCWGAFGGSTKRPNHGVANDLAEKIRAAAEATMWEPVPEVALPPGVMPVWLSSIDVIRGVRRVPDENYAHYSLDVHIGWIEREALAGVAG
jgi:hypothetical protein